MSTLTTLNVMWPWLFLRITIGGQIWALVSGSSTSALRTAPQSCAWNWERQKQATGICLLVDKSFQCKMCDVVVQLWHPHPPLMYMLDIIGWVPSIEQIANPLVYAAKSWKVLTLQLLGRQEKNGEALWMEKEFHSNSTGLFFLLFFFFKSFKAKEDGWSKLASLLPSSSKPCTEQAAHQGWGGKT